MSDEYLNPISDIIKVVLIGRPSVLQSGMAQSIRASKFVQLSASVDTFDLAPKILHAISPDVIIILPAACDIIPDIFMRAGNVLIFSTAGDLHGIVPAELTLPMLEKAILVASATVRKRKNVTPTINVAQLRTEKMAQSAPDKPALQFGTQQKLVLNLMVKGLTNGEIAQVMGLSLPTARYHVSAILNKMGVSNRTEACAMAVKHQLIDSSQH